MTGFYPHEIIAEGLGFPEGPVAMADGSVLVVEIRPGRITRIHPDGRKETVATPGGGPNGGSRPAFSPLAVRSRCVFCVCPGPDDQNDGGGSGDGPCAVAGHTTLRRR